MKLPKLAKLAFEQRLDAQDLDAPFCEIELAHGIGVGASGQRSPHEHFQVIREVLELREAQCALVVTQSLVHCFPCSLVSSRRHPHVSF